MPITYGAKLPAACLPRDMWPELDRVLARTVNLGPSREQVLASIEEWLKAQKTGIAP